MSQKWSLVQRYICTSLENKINSMVKSLISKMLQYPFFLPLYTVAVPSLFLLVLAIVPLLLPNPLAENVNQMTITMAMLVALVVEVGGVWGWESMWGLVNMWRVRVMWVAAETILVKERDGQQTSLTMNQAELREEGKAETLYTVEPPFECLASTMHNPSCT